MRIGLMAVAAVVMSAASAAAQSASSFFTNVPPGSLTYQPIDTTKAVAPVPGQSATIFNRFNFTALFSKRIVPSGQPIRGVSNLPPPSSFPSTRYTPFRMVGEPPFLLEWMFRGSRNNSPLQPVAPIIPQPGQTPVGPGSG